MLKIVLLEKQVMEAGDDDSARTQLLLEKASLYKGMAEYSEALFTLNRIADPVPVKAECEMHYQKAFNAYMLRSFSLSLQEIWSAAPCGLDENAAMLHLMILLENERWDEFKTEFLNRAEARPFGDTLSFLQEFQHPQLLDVTYYVKKAVIPGAGLIKSGHTGKGITNIVLQLAFAGFAVYNIHTGFYLTGFFSGVQPMRRFYSGGKILTGSLVRQKNEDSVDALKRTGYTYIEQLYSR
jgi:hypothetical protein